MDILEIASNIVIPRWVKAVVVAMLALLVAAYGVMVFLGVTGDAANDGWIEAAAYVLGILLPIFLIGLVIMYAETGIEALRHRSYKYLTEVVPERTVMFEPITEKSSRTPPPWRRRVSDKRSMSAVYMAPSNAGEAVRYEVIAPIVDDRSAIQYKMIRFLIQLNVQKSNVVIFLPEKALSRATAPDRGLDELFPHSMRGAAAEGYMINPASTRARFNNDFFQSFVLIKRLPEKFMLNSNERLYFAQDVMMMLRAMLNETPELFEDAASDDVRRFNLKKK